MRAALGYVILSTVLLADCPAAGPMAMRTVPAPVRLPAVTSIVQPRLSATPMLFQPIAVRDFDEFELDPAVELDWGLPQEPRTRIGGWIDVGYRSGAIAQ